MTALDQVEIGISNMTLWAFKLYDFEDGDEDDKFYWSCLD